MKREVSPSVVVGVIVVVVIGIALLIWRGLGGPDYKSAGDVQLEKIAQEMKAQGKDIRLDPMLGPEYLKLHPEEKLPAGQMPNPMKAVPAPREGLDTTMPLAPPPPRALGN
ncbi:MAG TPA: hypothetical protein VNJ09_01405 [Chthonomonadales bacterium]|nr:hypothetical protein [Chthonomonadales bacterium]